MAETMPLTPAPKPACAERQAVYTELAALARRARDAGLPSVALVLDLAAAMDPGEGMPTQRPGATSD